ncbi:MAG: hypothetical protein AB7F31_00965 [Parachlamydiales bacterium]
MISTVSPQIPYPPTFPETSPFEGYATEVFKFLDKLGTNGQALKVEYLAAGTLEVSDGERSIRITGLDQIGKAVTDLLRKDQIRGADLNQQIDRLSKVSLLQTSLGVFSTTIGVAAGIATGGTAGIVLALGALLNGAHQVAQRTDFYHSLAGALTSDEGKRGEIGDALNTYIGYLCFAATLGSVAVGGTELLKKGFEEATKVTLQGVSDVTMLSQGLTHFAEAKLNGKRLELQADGVLINLELTQLGHQREEGVNRFGEIDKVEQAAFDAAMMKLRLERETSTKIMRGK